MTEEGMTIKEARTTAEICRELEKTEGNIMTGYMTTIIVLDNHIKELEAASKLNEIVWELKAKEKKQ